MDRGNRDKALRKYLGKTMTMAVDRPIGHIHKGIVYPVNYGHIPGMLAADGEAQDVYLLGVDAPVDSYTGPIIALIHRSDDVEDKLVMAPEGMRFFRHEIEAQVHFQEQYFHSKVESLWEKSCGAIVYRQGTEGIEYLCLLQNASWGYSAPKGHMEPGETEEQTACREIREETGLQVQLLPGFREKQEYAPFPGKWKELILFLAEGKGELTLQPEEIISADWLPLHKAQETLHPDYTPVLEKAEAFIREQYKRREDYVE